MIVNTLGIKKYLSAPSLKNLPITMI